MIRLLAWVFDVGERLPAWTKPPIAGAALVFGVVLIRMLFAVPVIVRYPKRWREFGLGLLAAAGAGAAGGLCHSLIGKHLRQIPEIGPYLAGVVSAVGYMGAFLLAAPYVVPNDPLVENRMDLVAFAIAAVAIGLGIGHGMFREKSDDSAA